MKRLLSIITIITASCILSSAQKLTEPKFLGSWIAGEDPSEFLLHSVMQYSQGLLEGNPKGKLIVRICSSDEFSTAFVKAPLNPLAASKYNQFTKQIIVPYEKIFIANSSKCFEGKKFIFNQYWFVPDKNTLEYDEIFSVNNITYKSLDVNDYDYSSDNYRKKSLSEKDKDFMENITEFVNELKNNPKSEGFIIHNSKSKTMKRNIEKAYAIFKRENIDLQRIKNILRIRLDGDENGELKPIKDEKKSFPALEVITINK